MDTVCQVEFNLMTRQEARRSEGILREYLLRASDQMCMTRKDSSWLSTYSLLPHPFRTKRFLSLLGPNDLASREEHFWTFNLTENVKNLLNRATLFSAGNGRFFYNLTDPKFLKQGKEVASYIASDRLLTLHISDSDKAELAGNGVYLDSPQI